MSTQNVTAVAPDGEWRYLRGQASARDCRTLCRALTAVGPCVCLYACKVVNKRGFIFLERFYSLFVGQQPRRVLNTHKLTARRTSARKRPTLQQQGALANTFHTLIC